MAPEASGQYWLGLHCRLTQAGIRVRVVNPLQPTALRAAGIREAKTDQRAVSVLAFLHLACALICLRFLHRAEAG